MTGKQQAYLDTLSRIYELYLRVMLLHKGVKSEDVQAIYQEQIDTYRELYMRLESEYKELSDSN